jgi:hypothetical protein
MRSSLENSFSLFSTLMPTNQKVKAISLKSKSFESKA